MSYETFIAKRYLLSPRSDKSIYSSLIKTNKVKLDVFSKGCIGSNNLFIGHYSTIIFQLIAQRERVLLIDIEWDNLPNHIYNSTSIYIKWFEFDNIIKNIDINTISYSRPTDELLTMFHDKANLSDLRILKDIFT